MEDKGLPDGVFSSLCLWMSFSKILLEYELGLVKESWHLTGVWHVWQSVNGFPAIWLGGRTWRAVFLIHVLLSTSISPCRWCPCTWTLAQPFPWHPCPARYQRLRQHFQHILASHCNMIWLIPPLENTIWNRKKKREDEFNGITMSVVAVCNQQHLENPSCGLHPLPSW